jgi:hypothetical protein
LLLRFARGVAATLAFGGVKRFGFGAGAVAWAEFPRFIGVARRAVPRSGATFCVVAVFRASFVGAGLFGS